MKKIYLLFLLLSICFIYLCKASTQRSYKFPANILTDSLPVMNHTHGSGITAPFQGKRIFCSYGGDSKYTVIIHGNNAIIMSDKKRIKGVFKKDKLFTNDPDEIAYRKFAGKYNYGQYYVIGTDYFSILNAENGEYSYYTLCK